MSATVANLEDSRVLLDPVQEKAALEVVRRTVSMAEKKGVKAKSQPSETVGSVVQAITDHAASEKIDLIVMGTREMEGPRKCSSEAY
jgi:nucleotide-binding universal stress UspA family protein